MSSRSTVSNAMPSKPGRSKPKAIDLFSGCGGLSEGLRLAGFRVVCAVENDELAAESYRMNHRRTKLFQIDIRKLSAKSVMETLKLGRGQIDLIAACPPCQGFSTMRTLNGNRIVEDHRNDLVEQVARFVRVLRPKAVLLENVPALKDDPRFDKICAVLSSLGYHYETRILNAKDFGVPQRRRRMVLVALLNRAVSIPVVNEPRSTVRKAIGALPKAHLCGDDLHHDFARRSEKVMRLIRAIPKDGGSRSSLSEGDRLNCHVHCDGFKDVYGRMAWDDVAPTITGGCLNPSKGRFLHPEEDRAITLREAALLQSFPPTFKISLDQGYYKAAVLIGNAFPPTMVRHTAAYILNRLKEPATDAV